MKLAIVGSRTFINYKLLLDELTEFDNITEIVSGGAKGADTLAERYAKEKNIPTKIFEAEWNKYGKRAGPIRNREIWEYADQGIAFLGVGSKGTANSIEMAIFFNKKVKIIKI